MKKISVLGRLNRTFFASPRPMRITWTAQYLLWVMLPVHNFQHNDTLRGVHWPKVCFCVDRNWVKLVSITRSSIQLSLHSEEERFPQFKEEQRKRKTSPCYHFWIVTEFCVKEIVKFLHTLLQSIKAFEVLKTTGNVTPLIYRFYVLFLYINKEKMKEFIFLYIFPVTYRAWYSVYQHSL